MVGPIVTDRWIKEAVNGVADARARSLPSLAYQALQSTAGDGAAQGPLPCTDNAIELFTAAHDLNPDDVGVVHHLAIAHHARAWDLELAGDPAAAREWEKALGFWRIVSYSSDFWSGMEAKLLSCDANGDPKAVRELQRNLLEDLLGVHVEFIRHYCETGVPGRAGVHIRIIQNANIPPAAKKRLESRVLEAMTTSVPDAKAAGEHESAMLAVERFLELFPDNLAGIRMLAEITKLSLTRLSWQHDWDAIGKLHDRVSPPTRRGAASAGLPGDALARAAIEDLALEFMARGTDRGWPALRQSDLGAVAREEAAAAFQLAIGWGRITAPWAATGSGIANLLAAAILGHAVMLRREAIETRSAGPGDRHFLRAARDIFCSAVAELEEAAQLNPVEAEIADVIRGVLGGARDDLAHVESQINQVEWGAS